MSIITEGLERAKQTQKKELGSNEVLNQVKGLLDYDSAKDRDMLKAMGLDKQINAAQKVQATAIDLENFEKNTVGQVFHIDNIKQLAIDYRLRFLPSNRYSGTIDVQVPAKIKQFAKENNLELTHNKLEYNFFMLAPAECFDLKLEIIDKDPALFYKLDDKHYALVHKWGNDFSPLRALQGWRYKTIENFLLFAVAVGLLVGSLVTSLLTPLAWFAEGTYYIPMIFTSFVTWRILTNDFFTDAGVERRLSKNIWHSEKRYD